MFSPRGLRITARPGRKPPFLAFKRPCTPMQTRHRRPIYIGKREGRLNSPGGPGRVAASWLTMPAARDDQVLAPVYRAAAGSLTPARATSAWVPRATLSFYTVIGWHWQPGIANSGFTARVILLSFLSFSFEMTVSPLARRAGG